MNPKILQLLNILIDIISTNIDEDYKVQIKNLNVELKPNGHGHMLAGLCHLVYILNNNKKLEELKEGEYSFSTTPKTTPFNYFFNCLIEYLPYNRDADVFFFPSRDMNVRLKFLIHVRTQIENNTSIKFNLYDYVDEFKSNMSDDLITDYSYYLSYIEHN